MLESLTLNIVSSSFTTSFLILLISFLKPANFCSKSSCFWIFSICFFSAEISLLSCCFSAIRESNFSFTGCIFSCSSFLRFKRWSNIFWSSILSSVISNEFWRCKRLFSCSLFWFCFSSNSIFFFSSANFCAFSLSSNSLLLFSACSRSRRSCSNFFSWAIRSRSRRSCSRFSAFSFSIRWRSSSFSRAMRSRSRRSCSRFSAFSFSIRWRSSSFSRSIRSRSRRSCSRFSAFSFSIRWRSRRSSSSLSAARRFCFSAIFCCVSSNCFLSSSSWIARCLASFSFWISSSSSIWTSSSLYSSIFSGSWLVTCLLSSICSYPIDCLLILISLLLVICLLSTTSFLSVVFLISLFNSSSSSWLASSSSNSSKANFSTLVFKLLTWDFKRPKKEDLFSFSKSELDDCSSLNFSFSSVVMLIILSLTSRIYYNIKWC